ncbi:MAG: methylated-DNA--[protein]-cysteine methyltransferase, partial [Firmicutes bacterium]|nr:methylated-DNA--[protein]-cysteine methyltransferase [Bacillota bacterium]
MNNIFTFDTPIGCLTIGDNGRAIVQVSFDLTSKNTNLKGQPCKIVQTPLINQAFDQLTEYFEKKRQKFDLPLCLNGTPFQTAVWQALMQIPFGKPCSYA